MTNLLFKYDDRPQQRQTWQLLVIYVQCTLYGYVLYCRECEYLERFGIGVRHFIYLSNNEYVGISVCFCFVLLFIQNIELHNIRGIVYRLWWSWLLASSTL